MRHVLVVVLMARLASEARADPEKWFCNSDDCYRDWDECVERSLRGAGPCRSQQRAACFSLHWMIRDETEQRCSPSMTACEDAVARAKQSPEVSDVGVCSVVDARKYRWLKIGGLLVGAVVALWLLVTKVFPLLGRSKDERWRRRTLG